MEIKGEISINQGLEQECGELIYLCKRCFEENCVGSFYCDSNEPGQHLTGYIAAFSEDQLVIAHISPNGFYDGYILMHTSNLTQVDIHGQYEIKIEKIYKHRMQTHPVVDFDKECFYYAIMDFAHSNNLLICAELENHAVTGFVLDYNDDHIRLLVVDDFGHLDGETVIAIEDVILFSVDSLMEQDRKLLYSIAQGTVP